MELEWTDYPECLVSPVHRVALDPMGHPGTNLDGLVSPDREDCLDLPETMEKMFLLVLVYLDHPVPMDSLVVPGNKVDLVPYCMLMHQLEHRVLKENQEIPVPEELLEPEETLENQD